MLAESDSQILSIHVDFGSDIEGCDNAKYSDGEGEDNSDEEFSRSGKNFLFRLHFLQFSFPLDVPKSSLTTSMKSGSGNSLTAIMFAATINDASL